MILAPTAGGASHALPATQPLPTSIPPAWTPASIVAGASTRHGGLVRGAFDAFRGVAERGSGQGLTPAQVAVYEPFFAGAFGLDPKTVRGDLRAVRILLGGPAEGGGSTATTIGRSLYVPDAEDAARILSWQGRRWLAHELTHTMQWRREGAAAPSDAARDKVFLTRYLGGVVHDDGKLGAGMAMKALATLWKQRSAEGAHDGLGEVLHDSHPMEVEAIRVAERFRADTTSPS